MKTQNISLFNINQAFSIKKQNQEKNQTQQPIYPQIDKISNNYYPIFCGKNKSEKVIEKLLNDENYDVEQKYYLQYLITSNIFEDAAKGLDEKSLKLFLDNMLLFSPASEDILKGNYVAIYENKEKPLFDLNSIAEYNKKHPQKPKNLLYEFFDNPLVSRLLIHMQMNNLDKLDGIGVVQYEENDLNIETKIKYSQRIPSKKEIEELKNKKTPSFIKDMFSFKSIPPSYKSILWELTEIPYFNAIIQNTPKNDLELLIETIDTNKSFMMELLKGNVSLYDKESDKTMPLIDLKNIAINNYKENIQNQKLLYNVIFENKLIANIYQNTLLYKTNTDNYPDFLYFDEPSNLINGFTPRDIKTKTLLNEMLKNKFNLIIFKNDLNNIVDFKEKDLIRLLREETSDNNQINILEKRNAQKTSKLVMEILKNPEVDNKTKEIVYSFIEDIPYFNYLTKNSNLEALEILIDFKKTNSKLFEKLIAKKINISEKYINESITRALLDTKELAIQEKNLNTVLHKNSLIYHTFFHIDYIEKSFKENQKIKTFSIISEPNKKPYFLVDLKDLPIRVKITPEKLHPFFENYFKTHNKTSLTITIED